MPAGRSCSWWGVTPLSTQDAVAQAPAEAEGVQVAASHGAVAVGRTPWEALGLAVKLEEVALVSLPRKVRLLRSIALRPARW